MNLNKFLDAYQDTLSAMTKIVEDKNRDYASVDYVFKNFESVEKIGICSTEIGIMTRMSDKMSRVANLLNRKENVTNVKDESIMDTLVDLANYAIILKLYIENKRETEAGKDDQDIGGGRGERDGVQRPVCRACAQLEAVTGRTYGCQDKGCIRYFNGTGQTT